MTAFEILLNKFYETIEENEPKNGHPGEQHSSADLFTLIHKFIDTSFIYGHNLKYKSIISDLLEKAANILQNTNHEDWVMVKYKFVENDLHIIRRDRGKAEIATLKMKLDQAF